MTFRVLTLKFRVNTLMKDLSTRTSALFTDCTRDKILKNSLELFNRKGFVSVTTSLLASSAKVREGTLWYHFKSKKSLVESHIDLFKANIDQRLDTVGKIDLEILIKQLFSQYYFNWDFRYLFRDNLADNLSTDKSISNKLNDLTQLRFNQIKQEALTGRELGVFDFKENELDELSEIIFLVADNWFALSSKKYPDKDENFLMQRGMGLLIKVSEPYLSRESKIIIKDLHGGVIA